MRCFENMKVVLMGGGMRIANKCVYDLELYTNSYEFLNNKKKHDDWTFFDEQSQTKREREEKKRKIEKERYNKSDAHKSLNVFFL